MAGNSNSGRKAKAGRRTSIHVSHEVYDYLSRNGISQTIEKLAREKMEPKYFITIKIDDEGMFGGIDSAELDKVDTTATVEKYIELYRNAVKKDYPEATVDFQYAPYAGRSVVIITDSNEADDENELGPMTDLISEIGGRIFDAGDFWYSFKLSLPVFEVIEGTDDWPQAGIVYGNTEAECQEKAQTKYNQDEYHWANPVNA